MTDVSAEFLALQHALAGEYSLAREIGRGGMGIVYLARDVQLDRDVAIKVLPTHLAHDVTARERFVREARTAAGLSHPNIVPIHRVGEVSGFVFFVMTYVEGETLGERLRRRGPLPQADATRILREVSWALAYAHGRGIVHRDVKPDNILLEAGTDRALVTDFGIAHGGRDADAIGAEPGKIVGTAHFMSPEQAANDPVDGRSDIYSLGVVGYLALSGRLPFESSNSLPAVLVRQATEEAPSVTRAAPGLPTALGAAIDRCIARDPEERFADAEAVAAALAPAVETRPALPATLRAWLDTRNPLLAPYLGWSSLFGALTTANFIAWVTGNRPAGPAAIVVLAGIASLPLLPVVGFHLHQARRQFRAGHTLADLRAALNVARRERAETEALAREDDEPTHRRLLRLGTAASASWLAVTFGFLLSGAIHENRGALPWILTPLLSTMLLGAVSNALDIQFIPDRIRAWWQTGVRERLWRGKFGAWLSHRLGAPERTGIAGASAFRATEAALGVAASELYAALPRAYREQLSDLPHIVEALEARAALAREAGATEHLGEAVAALEGIRLDLLRLHAGASDLAPITTLMDAARLLGDDIGRLADAQRDVDRAAERT